MDALLGEDTMQYFPDGATEHLWRACEYGDAEAARAALEAGAQVNFTHARYHCRTPLHSAASLGEVDDEIVRMLIDAGADVNAEDEVGCRPLHMAAVVQLSAVARLRGGASDDAAEHEGAASAGDSESTRSPTPNSDASMREEAEDTGPLSAEQLAQLRALPLPELIPLCETCGVMEFQRARQKSPGELAEALSLLDGPRREFLKEALAEIASAAGPAAQPSTGARSEAKRPVPPGRANVHLQTDTARKYPRRSSARAQLPATAVGAAAGSGAAGSRGAGARHRPQLQGGFFLRGRRPRQTLAADEAVAEGEVGRLGESDGDGGRQDCAREDVGGSGASRSRRRPALSSERVPGTSDSAGDDDEDWSPSVEDDGMATGGGDDDEKELEIVMDKDLREEEEEGGGEVKRTRVKRRSPAVVKGMRKGDRSAWPRFCQYARGCLNFPLYGEYWDKMPRFCIEHRHDHHINVRGVGKNKYMGLAVNGSRVIDVRNIAVVEDPSNPEDAERLRKCFEPYHDCVLCGAKGWVDWYYDFPIYAKRLCIRDIMNFISLEQTGRPCMSPPPELYDELWKNVPPGPFATEGDEEWKRFEGTQEGLDARTNKDVREAEQIKRMWEEECKIAAAETPEQRKAYVDEFLKRSRENQRAIDVASKGDASAPSSQDPDAPPRVQGARRAGARSGDGARVSRRTAPRSRREGASSKQAAQSRTRVGTSGLLQSFSSSKDES